MDKEFHYWITGIVARRAGFDEDEAGIIAHACQLVDDNDMRRTILKEDDPAYQGYEAYISQTMDILKPKQELMRIYPIFHFLPGQYDAHSARRSDGKMHILTTTPDSDRARKVLRAALAENAPHRRHRIGVAAHAYADTWAHQNFVGWYDGINGQDMNFMPNIGHADFMHHPDWVGHRWDDSRVIASEVNNNHRFLDAAKRLYEEFAAATGNPAAGGWAELQSDLLDAMGPVSSGERLHGEAERLKKYRALFPELPDYMPDSWLNAAVRTEVNGLPDDTWPSLTLFNDEYFWKPGWETSDWLLFQEAVKAHQQFCMAELTPLFQQMNVNLREH